jgi:basic membrane protein A and related proteins
MKRRTFLAGTAATAGLAASGAAFAADVTKAAYIYVGPVGDMGYNYQHDLGRKEMEKALGSKVKASIVENVPEGADAERVLTQLALQGNNIIFATSFGYMDAVLNVAKKFPKVKFEHATGYKRADNVATYSARFYEGRAVIGTIAGRMTKTNKIGYIASFPIPEVIRGINAAYIHAKKVNPKVEFKIVWVSTWADPAKEADAANALIEQGVDVIMQHTDTTAAMSVAEKKGVFAFGQSSNMAAAGPKAQLTAIVDEWGPYYTQRVTDVMNGTWKSTDTWGGIAAGMVTFAPFNKDMPADVAKEANDLIEAIKSGKYKPFTGPLNKQDGSVWLKEGETADDGTLAGLNFYVQGITGDIPK